MPRSEGRAGGATITIRVPVLIFGNLLAAALAAGAALMGDRFIQAPAPTQEQAVRVVADQLQRNIGERLAVVEQKVDDLRSDVRELRKEGRP